MESYISYFLLSDSIRLLFCNVFSEAPIAPLVTSSLFAISILFSGFSISDVMILFLMAYPRETFFAPCIEILQILYH